MRRLLATVLISAAAPLAAQIATPDRPVTDPKSLTSPADPAARPVPIDDLGFSRGLLGAAWSADGKRFFLSTNLTGRFNVWRADADGSWPVQLAQSDDRQLGLTPSPDGKTLYFQQDVGGDEQYDIYAVPADGGAVVNLTNTPDLRENGMVISRNGTMHRDLDQAQSRRPDQCRGDGRRIAQGPRAHRRTRRNRGAGRRSPGSSATRR